MAGLSKRGTMYYAIYNVAGKERRRSLNTSSYQLAKERLRKLESTLACGGEEELPTKTRLRDIVEAYVIHMRNTKTANGAKVDTWYLRSIFGPICPALQMDKQKRGQKKSACKEPQQVLEVAYIEQLTASVISEFISNKVLRQGIAPKTANRYREILMRLVSWAISQRGVRMPGDRNPALKVERYREHAAQIRFLTLKQIDEQLEALEDNVQLQTMVAVYIYAGLRREEALWLTVDDIDLSAGKYGMIRVQAKTVAEESWQPKTKVNRVVPVSSTLRPCLERYKPKQVSGRWYFSTVQGERWNPDNFYHALQDANRKAGLQWSCLDFRHTFGSQLAMKGESLYKISTLMGNSPEICRRHYATLIPESMIESVEFSTPTMEPPLRPQLRLLPQFERRVDESSIKPKRRKS